MRSTVFNSFVKAMTLCLLLCAFVFQTGLAAPVKSHSHEGRTHSHALPKSGVKHYHKHTHNGRAHIHPYSAKIGFKHTHNQSPRAKAWANAVKHEHGGRPHSHPLPRSGTKHDHRHRHGGRSHIHPLPVSGVKHFHRLNHKSTKQVAKAPNTPRMITGLSIKQQMAAVLKYPLPKTSVTPVAQRKTVTPAPRKSQRNVAVMNQRTINKVLGRHSHNGRVHIHPTQIAGAKHSHKKRVKLSKPKPLRKIVRKKRTPIKPPQKRKVTPKKAQTKLAKKPTPKPIKAQAVPRKTKQTPQQIVEGNRQFALALRYENGTGIKKNLPQAFNWYQRAAKNGNAKAQFNLASLYENGEGTKQNIAQAIHWYTAAANNGDANAQVNLGNRYAEGRNVPKNIREAAKWYKRAADQGNLRGRANLNYLIEDYNGVIKR